MIFVTSRFAFLLCFVYFCTSASQTLEPNDDDAINEYWTKRSLWRKEKGNFYGELPLYLPAVSSGKTLYKAQESLSEDTVRTAKAIMSLFVQPSTWYLFETMLHDSFNKTAEAKWNGTLPDQAKFLCEMIVEEFKTKTFDSAAF